jgi:hypothetical protein
MVFPVVSDLYGPPPPPPAPYAPPPVHIEQILLLCASDIAWAAAQLVDAMHNPPGEYRTTRIGGAYAICEYAIARGRAALDGRRFGAAESKPLTP